MATGRSGRTTEWTRRKSRPRADAMGHDVMRTGRQQSPSGTWIHFVHCECNSILSGRSLTSYNSGPAMVSHARHVKRKLAKKVGH